MEAELNEILNRYVAHEDDTREKLLGCAFVVVGRNGMQPPPFFLGPCVGTLYQGSAGRTDLPLDSPAFTPESVTWVASMTKIATATCIMQLVEGGHIRLHDDVRSIVPEFLGRLQILRGFDEEGRPILEENVKPVTLRQLLTHTVGLGYDRADSELMRWSEAVGRTVTNLTFTLEGWSTPLKFAPGEGWYYGSAMDWAGQVLERVLGGVRLGTYMAQRLWKPLGMTHTSFASPAASAGTAGGRQGKEGEGMVVAACSYRDTATGKLSTGPPPVPIQPPVDSGGAGLWTSAVDHAKVLGALLDDSGVLLKPDTVAEMFRPQLDDQQRTMLGQLTDAFREGMAPEFPAGTPMDHGLGGVINTEDVPGKRRGGSMMWQGMANGHWWVDRQAGVAATLMVNVMPMPDTVVLRLYDELERAVYRYCGVAS